MENWPGMQVIIADGISKENRAAVLRIGQLVGDFTGGIGTPVQHLFHLQGGIFILMLFRFLQFHIQETLSVTFQFRAVLIDTVLFSKCFTVGIKPEGKGRCIEGLRGKYQE